MKLFEYTNYKLKISDEALTLKVFKDLHDRDKTKDKEIAFKELAFIYHMCDIKSDFLIINNEKERADEVCVQVGLPENWIADEKVLLAMDLYKERTISPTMRIYLDALKGALDTTAYLSNAGVLLRERNTNTNMPVIKPNDITASLDKVSKIIKDLKLAEKEVIKEQKDTEGRQKGSQTFNIYEEGLNIS